MNINNFAEQLNMRGEIRDPSKRVEFQIPSLELGKYLKLPSIFKILLTSK